LNISEILSDLAAPVQNFERREARDEARRIIIEARLKKLEEKKKQ
jgi:hypothetical protein